MANTNVKSIEYRVEQGILPMPEVFKQYYIIENHSFSETIAHFNMTKKTAENYMNKYNIKKGIDIFGEKRETSEKTLEQTENLSENNVENIENVENNDENALYLKQKARYQTLKYNSKAEIEDIIFQFCFEFNIFYDTELVNRIKTEELLDKMPSVYLEEIKTEQKYQGLTFFSQIKRENFENIYSEPLILLGLSEEDKKNRQQIMSIIGIDPFKNDDPSDRPQLYRDLTGMLSENMRKDVAKQKAAISVVRGYANINRYQQKVNAIMARPTIDAESQGDLDTLLGVINKIQTSINQTTKENGFTGGKTIGNNGQGMLSDVMNQVELQGYDPGVTNYYDIATSKAIQDVADISFKSMMNQVKLSNTDYVEILSEQSKMVREAQATARDAMEALRIARSKITKQELLDELSANLKKKGISEEDIIEFINREYELYDGGR